MKISTKGRYGLKAMIDIAVYATENQTSLKNIALRQDISEAYLEQLIASLKKAGLVKSTRGAKGGYVLALPPEEIKIGTVLRVLEGSLSPVDCQKNGCHENCDCCVSKTVWSRLEESLNDAADAITLQELAQDYIKVNNIQR